MVKVGGRTFRHCSCELCSRDFVEDLDSGEQYAANVTVFGFDRLHDDVSRRWLSEPCPQRPQPGDDADRELLRGKG